MLFLNNLTDFENFEKNGEIYLKGDTSHTDILKDVKILINGYISEFDALKNNQNVCLNIQSINQLFVNY